jgi:PilZ domain-containing protein
MLAYEDIVFVERRRNLRIIVNIAGHFSISSRRAARGARAVFPCRAVNVSNRAIALIAAVGVEVNDLISAQIEHLGKLEGCVFRLIDGGFVMAIAASKAEREKLDDKLHWLERHKNLEALELRADPRLTPERPRNQILLADGTTIKCTILDVSASGAAISAEIIPEIGTVLAIGTAIGRVVRHFKGGFALKFIERLSDDRLTAMLRS